MVIKNRPVSGKSARISFMVASAFLGWGNAILPGDAQTPAVQRKPGDSPEARRKVDLSQGNTLYLVGYAHLDTQWRWSYPQVIREFIPNTMNNNFRLFDLYPDYIFNFSGSRRYEMMKEYYPADYARVKAYIKAGRWFPCGSSVDEGDANVPSGESLTRHILYGNHYFRREFGIASQEFMLPDCFGFPYALPTILAHNGIQGFSTQKLTWGSAVGIPFKVGTWEGPDGSRVISALDPGAYTGGIGEDLSQNTSWLARIQNTGKQSGAYVDYHYYGAGDRGGAPGEDSVKWMEKSLAGMGPIHVVSSRAEDMYQALTPDQIAKLPRYKGELLLTRHSAGAITSQAYMKRWNRKNELLADDAERASVAAMWLGGVSYPSQRLYDAWDLVLGSQMHDMLPGTSLPQAYNYCWNDELLALNQFAAVTQDAVGAIASQLDTRGQGTPLVVYNPLSVARQDVVEASVPLPSNARSATVYGPDGKAVPAQIADRSGGMAKILFAASVPSTGFAVYDVRSSAAAPGTGSLKVGARSLENARFRVTLNAAGDIASIYDKKYSKEALKAPARLAFQYESPAEYPAWNMDWDDAKQAPRDYVHGPASIRIVEAGPARVALEVTRETDGSKFVQTIRLAAGGDRVEIANKIDWNTRESALKASFPFTTGNPKATYDLQAGAIERGNDDPEKYEVPQHQWFDLTETDGRYGVAVLNDSKFGSNKPDDDTMRLTLLYTPGVRGGYHDQETQDIGRHDILYAVAPHAGDWRQGDVAWQAKRLNQPLLAFAAPPHAGALGRSFSFLSLNTRQVQVMAVKKAEDSGEIVVRLRELQGKPAQGVQLRLAGRIVSAREVNGQEMPLGPAKIVGGALVTNVPAFGLKAFAIRLAPPAVKTAPAMSSPVVLSYDLDVASRDGNRSDGAFDDRGRTIAAEQLPASLTADGVVFKLGPTTDGAKNAVSCHGQTIKLPAGYSRVYLLAAATGDTPTHFRVGDISYAATVQNWGGFIGQWDNRLWGGVVPELTYDWYNPYVGLVPGYVKTDEVAWFSSHRHTPTGNDFYRYSYLFKYGFTVPAGAASLTLPRDPHIRVLAVTVARNAHDAVRSAEPLYDTLSDHVAGNAPTVSPASGRFTDSTAVTLQHPLYWREGGLHYTLDGSAPTASSPVYAGPLTVDRPTTIKTAEIGPDGRMGPVAVARLDVRDTTAPKVVLATSLQGLTQAMVRFSEPVRKETAENTANYRFDANVHVTSARLEEDGRTVDLTLDKWLTTEPDTPMTVTGVRDLSPAANETAGQRVLVKTGGCLFASGALKPATPQTFKVAELPVHAHDPWTINLFFKTDKQPANRTLIAGFGRASDGGVGVGRYLAKFANGIHFWSAQQDVDTTIPLDLGRWQMLTATYDGVTLRLYKDGAPIGAQKVDLADDRPEVHVLPKDAWEHERVIDGEVRDMTIWNQALTPDSLRTLLEAGK